MNSPEQIARFSVLMRNARRTNADRDAIDQNVYGQAKYPMRSRFRDAIAAIEAGLKAEAWECVAEGLDMLQEVDRSTVVLGSTEGNV